MSLERRKPRGPHWELHEDEVNWTAGVGRPAGVYWLEGRSVIAAHDSPAEAVLLERGAVLIATLRFDRDPLESVHRAGSVERMAAQYAAGAFLVSAPN